MTQLPKPVARPAELTLDHWQEGTFFGSRDASFGAQHGLRDLGISYGEVPADKFLAKSRTADDEPAFRSIGRSKTWIDYWDGEPGI